MDLLDLLFEPRRTISVGVILLSVLFALVAITSIPPTWASAGGVALFALAVGAAVAAIASSKLPGALAAAAAVALCAAGFFLSFEVAR